MFNKIDEYSKSFLLSHSCTDRAAFVAIKFRLRHNSSL